MKQTKMGKSLIMALGAISPKLAADAGLPALVGEVTKKTFNKATVLAGLIAMDAECKEKAETVMDGFEDEETEPKEPKKAAKDSKKAKDDTHGGNVPAEDDDEEEKKKKAADAKRAKDEEMDDDAAPAQDKKAMDAFKKELRDADEARRAVRSVVGDVIGQDSAEEIYRFALDQMKIAHKDVTELAGLKALHSLASAQVATKPALIAQDSAGALARFPNAARFTHA